MLEILSSLQGAALLGAGVALGWYLHDRTSRTLASVPQTTASHLAQALVSITQKSLILRGLAPHHAEPATFAPSGVSHEVEEAIETQAVDTEEETPETAEQMSRALDEMLGAKK